MEIDLSQLKNLNILRDNNGRVYVKGSGNRIKVPELNSELALFLGLLWGDGCIANRSVAVKLGWWRTSIVEDDVLLIKEYCRMCKSMFDLEPKISDRETYLEAYVNNRIIYEILNQIFNLPDGEKKNRLSIPKQVEKSEVLMKVFLCGLFSTDGKFVLDKGYPRIGLSSASKDFLIEVYRILKSLNFRTTFGTSIRKKDGGILYEIYLNGYKQVIKFHSEIGFIGEKYKRLEEFISTSN